MSLIIKIEGEALDMFANEPIPVTYSVAPIGEIQDRTANFSPEISVPDTAKNQRLLKYASVLGLTGNNLYTGVDCELYDDLLFLDAGLLQVTDVDIRDGVIRIKYYGSNANWFELLKSRKLSEIDLSEFAHNWTAANVIASKSRTSGYKYPLINYGGITTANPAAIPLSNFLPSIFAHTLLHKIFNGIGYKLGGSLLSDPTFYKLLIPANTKDMSYSKEFIQERSGVATTAQSQAITQSSTAKVTPLRNGLSNGTNIMLRNFFPSVGRYVADVPMSIRVTAGVTVSAGDSVITNGTVRHAIYKNGVLLGSWYQAAAAGITSTGVGVSYGTITLLAGDYLEFFVENNDTANSFINYNIQAYFEMQPTFVAGASVQLNAYLPDMTQAEFVKWFLISLGVIPQVDTSNKLVKLDLFTDLKKNIGRARNWSDKIDIGSEQVMNYTDVVQDYGKLNVIRYAEDDNDNAIVQYRQQFIDDFGAVNFALNNAFLDDLVEVYDAPFGATMMTGALTNSGGLVATLLPYIPTSDGRALKPRILMDAGEVNVSQFAGGNYATITIGGTSTSSIGFAYFHKPFYGSSLDNERIGLAYGSPVGLYNDIPLVQSYLADFVSMLADPKFIKIGMRLNALDVFNLDFVVPIYLDYKDIQGYFYLNKIEQYTGNGEAVECQLIKLPTATVVEEVSFSPDDFFTNLLSARSISGNQTINLGTASDIQFNGQAGSEFTISFWFKADSIVNNARFLSNINLADLNQGFDIRMQTGGVIRFMLVNNNTGNRRIDVSTPASTFVTGQWYHVGVTLVYINNGVGFADASGVTVYVNGIAQTLTVNNNAINGTTASTANLFLFAQNNNSNRFTGRLDEVSIYNSALSIGEVLEIYNSGKPQNLIDNVKKPIHWWRFDGADLDVSGGVIDRGVSATVMNGSGNDMTNANNLTADVP